MAGAVVACRVVSVMTSPADGKEFFRRPGVALAVLVILTIYGIEAHARREKMATPATLGDQGAYLAYARQMYETNYAAIGPRNRMPVFPFLLSLVYRPDMSEAQFLRRAQACNVNLSIALLLLLFFIFRRFFSAAHALALLAATAFGVSLYRATNAQTEVLFYFVTFCAFLLLFRMLIAPRWWLAAAAGALVGLAHLTKASILPALGIWVAVFACQSIWKYCASRSDRLLSLWNRLGLLLIVLGALIAVVLPYIRSNKQIYGRYFYNQSSTFVMWCDSWPEALEFLEKFGAAQWRSLPPGQIPSPAKYWREHSVSQIVHRLMRGLGDLAHLKMQVIGYYKFVALFVLVAALFWIRWPRRARQVLGKEPFAAAFCLLFLVVYIVLYAWYGAIVKDTRFILSIFMPFVFAASLFIRAMGRDRSIVIADRRLPLMHLFSGALAGLALIDVAYNGVLAVPNRLDRAQNCPVRSITSVQPSMTSIPACSALVARFPFSAPGFMMMRRGFAPIISAISGVDRLSPR